MSFALSLALMSRSRKRPQTSLALTQLLKFPSQYYDSETARAQNWHRQYDAHTGRYIQAE